MSHKGYRARTAMQFNQINQINQHDQNIYDDHHDVDVLEGLSVNPVY